MKTIAEGIFNGLSSEEIGISKEEYLERKRLVDEFVKTSPWDSTAHILWLLSRKDIALSGGDYPDSHIWVKKEMPSTAIQAEGLIKDGSKIIASGGRFASEDVYQSRMAVCEKCANLQKNRCLKCGCYMKIKAKFAVMNCPINLW